jgi:hypothetical protein
MAKPKQQTREIAGYVIDSSKPNWIILANEVGVAVDKHTAYALETPGGLKKGNPANVVVGAQVRVTVGKNGVAVRVLVKGK